MAEKTELPELDDLTSTPNENPNDTDNSSSLISTPPKKRKPISRRPQKYRQAWESYPEFSNWLERVEENQYKAKCTVCCKVLVADLSVIHAHAQAKKHIRNLETNVEDLITFKPKKSFGNSATSSRQHRFDRESEDIPFDSLSISDHQVDGSFSAETGYIDQNITVEMAQVQHLPLSSRKGLQQEAPTFSSKAVVTKPAPPWKATAIVNGHVTRLELNDYKGRYLILFFYPQDFSAVCPTELLALSDRVLEFRALQTEIVACSVDSHLTHLAWARTPRNEGGLGNLKIPLLADPTHSIARDYGVLLPDLGHSLRAHFIIDRRGVLRHMLVNDLGVGRSIDELLRVTQALQHTDETETGCPADWKPGMPSV